MVYIKDFVSGQRIGYGASISRGSCECPECLVILRKAATCRHNLEKTATGPMSCPKCQHNYGEWLNYTPSKYYWIDHLLDTQAET